MKETFDPRHLKTIRQLIAEGVVPYKSKTIERWCKDGSFPGVKIGQCWHSTPEAARGFLWKRGNAAFRNATV